MHFSIWLALWVLINVIYVLNQEPKVPTDAFEPVATETFTGIMLNSWERLSVETWSGETVTLTIYEDDTTIEFTGTDTVTGEDLITWESLSTGDMPYIWVE